MSTATNEFGQPVGEPLDWSGARAPRATALRGRHVVLHRFQPATHAPQLFELFRTDDPSIWTYLSVGPYEDEQQFIELMERLVADPSNAVYAIEREGALVGFLEFLRINQRDGSIEIGFITMSRSLQRTTAATEALALMMSEAFDLGYRRLEWKCDDQNAASRAAAERLGFVYEGTFRQATHYKGRNRDTAWFSITDQDWPVRRGALEAWLDPENFDTNGHQRRTLRDLRGG